MPVSKKSGEQSREQSRYPLEQSRRCWWSMEEKISEKGMF